MPSHRAAAGAPIAVVGMAGRFPGAGDVDTLFERLLGGDELITRFSRAELEAAGVPRRLLDHPAYVPANGVLADIELFDAELFGFSPREAALLDPQQRLLLESCWHALEHAGCDPERAPGAIGAFLSGGLNSYFELNLRGHEELLAEVGAGTLRVANRLDNLATRVAYKLDLRGPAVAVQTGCSSSLVAVHLACQSLRSGECRLALAGGARVNLLQHRGYLHQPGSVLSADGHCRPFDRAASGTVTADGVAVVVLKPLAEALADGDFIHAVLLGSAINNDGSHKVGYTAPGVEGQTAVLLAAFEAAGVSPAELDFVEAHGTATALGDPIEVAALAAAFGDCPGHRCALGSIKSQLGHLDVAAGVAGLIKAALALRERRLPANLHFEALNPHIDLTGTPFFVADRPLELTASGRPLRAGVSSFGIGGTNAHVVLEEPPAPAPACPSERPCHLLPFSAASEAALERLAASLAGPLSQSPGLDLADAAFTLQRGRRRLEHRGFVVAASGAEAAQALESWAAAGRPSRPQPPACRGVALLFPGQGSQHPGAVRQVYRAEPLFRRELDRAAEVLAPVLPADLRSWLLAEPGDAEAAQELRATEIAQPALVAVELALARLWASWGVVPEVVAGHSVGELAAASVAGVMSFEEALLLAAERGRRMAELPPGGMLAVPLGEVDLEPWLGPALDVAAYNTPSLSVVSGSAEEVDALAARLAAAGIESRRLHTSHAFHSRAMEPAVGPFEAAVARLALEPPSLPLLSGASGDWLTAEEAQDPATWSRQIRRPVRFAAVLERLAARPELALVEVGPGQSLATLARRHPALEGRVVLPSLPAAESGAPDYPALLSALGGLWAAGLGPRFEALYEGERRRRVPLPGYPFERRRHWVEPPAPSESWRRPAGGALVKGPRVADWLWEVAWREAARPAPGAAVEVAAWLIVGEESVLARALATELAKCGGEVSRALPAEKFSRLGPGRFALDLGDPRQQAELLAAWAPSGPGAGRIVWLAGSRPGEGGRADLHGLLALARALPGSVAERRLELALVSRGLESVLGDEDGEPAQALAAGALPVLHQELPELRCRHLDLDTAASGEEATVLARELALPEAESARELALRGSRRWQPWYRPAAPPAEPELSLSAGGFYWIAGGLGRIGLALAEQLAERTGARLLLTGRRPPSAEVAARLEAIAGKCGGLLALEADVTDAGALAAALEAGRERFGELSGVFFAAGLSRSATPLAELDPLECERQLEAKVVGLPQLERALAATRPSFCCVLSSLSAVLGGWGAFAHAAAHRFLDAFVERRLGSRDHGPRSWLVVDLDAWRFGASAEARPGRGTLADLAMTPDEGVEALHLALARGAGRSLVSTADLEARLARAHAAPASTGAIEKSPRPAAAEAFSPTEAAVAEIWQRLLGLDSVRRDDDFFALGGHSLVGIQVVARLRELFGVELPVAQLFRAPTLGRLAELVDQLRGAGGQTAGAELRPLPPGQLAPLSFAQQRLWFLAQRDPRATAYNLPRYVSLAGRLDVAALARTLAEIVRRHQVLRSSFALGEDGPVQRVLELSSWPLPLLDLAALEPARAQAELEGLKAKEGNRPFELARGPLIRTRLVRLGPELHGLMLTLHHAASDAGSTAVLVREVGELYAAFAAGRPSPLAEPPLQYRDFAAWQRARFTPARLDAGLEPWRRYLAGAPVPPVLPRPAAEGTASRCGQRYRFELAPELARALAATARSHGTTLFAVLLAGLQSLLWVESGSRSSVVGVPSTSRFESRLEGLIGFFIETVPVAGEVSPEAGFGALVERTAALAAEAFAHQEVPFEKIVEALGPRRRGEGNPLFQVLFGFQAEPAGRPELTGLRLEAETVATRELQLPFILNFVQQGERLVAALEHDSGLFSSTEARRLGSRLVAFLERASARPEQPLGELWQEVSEAEESARQAQLEASREANQNRLRELRRRPPAPPAEVAR
ncbi:MAG: SDR family oxidoreductase [Thermoanaerobaculia bacterium]